MEEKLKHKKAFEQYYSMGDKRSLEKLIKKAGSPKHPYTVPSLKSLKRWSKAFKWQKRVKQRDAKNAKVIEREVDKAVVSEKVKYRKLIKQQLGIWAGVINTAIKENKKTGKKELVPQIETTEDLKRSTDSIDKLITTDLKLMGEDIDELTIVHKIVKQYAINKRSNNKTDGETD